MKKNLILFPISAALILTGCYGLKKVDYKTFKDEVNDLSEVKTKQVKIVGKVDGEKVDFTYDIPQTAGETLDSLLDSVGKYNKYQSAAIQVAVAEKTPAYFTLSESEDYSYYTGFGFKVKKNDGAVAEWNSKGLLFSVKDGETSLMFSWKKA